MDNVQETLQQKMVGKEKRLDPGAVQRQASDPHSSVWVTASAGTGKTKVLTDRVLRLLLNGATPDEILCITFTRAGAGVMTNRIREELSRWATDDDESLSERLLKLNGRRPNAEMLLRARQLFPAFLDSPEGMRIQTVHSFAQNLIRRFPIETGVPPYFDVMDEQTAADLLRDAQVEVLRSAYQQEQTPLAQAVRMVTSETPEDDFADLMAGLAARRGQLLKNIADHGGLEQTIDAVYAWTGALRGLDSKTLNERLNSELGLNNNPPDIKGLHQAADILAGGSATDKDKAKVIKAWLSYPDMRAELFWDYVGVFLTAEGEMRKKLTTKATAAAEDVLRKEGERLMEGNEIISNMNTARGTESLLRMTDAILQVYTEKKKSLNMLDYDDLVYKSTLLLKQDNNTGWVLQKLPGKLKHILVDEAQDTNPDQWDIVESIAREFFKDKTRKRNPQHTLFVVGDEKQSIFSFQRADPEEFGRRKKMFKELVEGAGGRWKPVDLDIAFRSVPAITEAVDAVFANKEALDGLFFRDEDPERKVQHMPFRKGQGGLVEVRPVVRPHEKPQEEVAWTLPLMRQKEENPAAEMAENIALQVRDWLKNGERLESRGRAMRPDDVLILVRRRSALVDYLVRALRRHDVPVAGADRMSLREQIAVMDLTALGDALLFPRDDYRLACVLKSPLVGMTDKQLEKIAIQRKGSLWESLEAEAADVQGGKIYKHAFAYLSGLREKCLQQSPYGFYSGVLMNPCPAHARMGLNAFYARLGHEAEDPIVEFMNAAERFEAIRTPTLQGFLSWLYAGETDVKREINLNPENQPRVHIMTVHGAKGLEAPVVILPDTTGIPSDNTRARPKFLWPDHERNVPLWVPRADLESKAFTREREKVELERDREFRRLLYVAMTRAADRLYVFGHQGARQVSEKSWYALIESGLKTQLQDKLETVELSPLTSMFNTAAQPHIDRTVEPQTALRYTSRQTAPARRDGRGKTYVPQKVSMPRWVMKNAPVENIDKISVLKPSSLVPSNDNKASPSEAVVVDVAEQEERRRRALEKGKRVHALLENLPDMPPVEREEEARNYLALPVWGLSKGEQRGLLKDIMRVLTHPEFAHLFTEQAKAEVSFAATVERQGIKHAVSGQIDRLLVTDADVYIVDYKNTRHVPTKVEDVSESNVAQMALYRLALQSIYPDKKVHCALLYTQSASLLTLDEKQMDASLQKAEVAALSTTGISPLPKATPRL